MTTTKRTIRGEKYSVEQLVGEAMVAAQPDTAAATAALQRMGHATPAPELVSRYARDAAILTELERTTGAAFARQIGKISFDNQEKAVQQVNAYLNRRNAGHRSQWGK